MLKKTFESALMVGLYCFGTPYLKVLQRGTLWPIERTLQNKSDAETETALRTWLEYKVREATYVQIAVSCFFPIDVLLHL